MPSLLLFVELYVARNAISVDVVVEGISIATDP